MEEIRTSHQEGRTEKKRKNSRNAEKRNARTIRLIVTAAVLVIFVVIEAANIFSKDRSYSETENRMLAQSPKFTWSSFTSGDFMSDMEEYVTDQFMLRDGWNILNLAVDTALGKRESNGVYIGRQNYLFEIPDEPNWEAVDRNLETISEFSTLYEKHDIHVVMALVPNAASVLDRYLPSNAPVRDQEADIQYVEEAVGDSLDFISLSDTMKEHKDEYIYYKTDHHWTTLGAKYAFDTLAEPMRISDPVTEYDIYSVSNDFSGTLAATSGYNVGKDEIDIYVPKNTEENYLVTYGDEVEKSPSVYVSSALDQKNQYEVFLGGNYARIDINTVEESDRKLLIFKDSYANCFIPFLIPYYQDIYIVDPRYYYDDAAKLITDNQISDILFLYNVDTFMTDNSIADVLEDAVQEAAAQAEAVEEEALQEEASQEEDSQGEASDETVSEEETEEETEEEEQDSAVE